MQKMWRWFKVGRPLQPYNSLHLIINIQSAVVSKTAHPIQVIFNVQCSTTHSYNSCEELTRAFLDIVDMLDKSM